MLSAFLLERVVQLDMKCSPLAGLRALSQIMADLDHKWIDVLKADIEVYRSPQGPMFALLIGHSVPCIAIILLQAAWQFEECCSPAVLCAV